MNIGAITVHKKISRLSNNDKMTDHRMMPVKMSAETKTIYFISRRDFISLLIQPPS
jgi:hypothetical protein